MVPWGCPARQAAPRFVFTISPRALLVGEMLYLSNTTDTQTVRIPAVAEKVDGVLTLTLKNTINLGTGTALEYTPRVFLVDSTGAFVIDADGNYITLDTVVDTSRLYYVALVELEDGMPEGEYEYTADVDGETVSTGLLIIGDRTPAVSQYDNTVTYEQYNS